MLTPYHAGLCDDHVHWYIKLISRHATNELHIESQASRTDVWRQVLDDSVKISSPPAQPVAFTIPDNAWYENQVNSIEAYWMSKPRFGLKDAESAGSQFTSQAFDFGEEEFDVSFLHDWNKDAFLLVKSLSDQDSSVDLAIFADVAGYSSGSDVLVKM